MVSNCMLLVASLYRHDEKLRGHLISLAIKPCLLELCCMLKPHILQFGFFNSRQKSQLSYDHNAPFHRHVWRSKVQSQLRTKERTKQWLFLNVKVSFQLLEDSQNPRYDNSVYNHIHRVWNVFRPWRKFCLKNCRLPPVIQAAIPRIYSVVND